MPHRHLPPAVAILLMAALATSPAGADGSAPSAGGDAAAAAPDRPPAAPRWQEVELATAGSLLFDGAIRMRRATAPFPEPGPWHGRSMLRIETESRASVLGADLAAVRTTSWIDPATGGSVLYEEHQEGKRWKRVEFRADGMHEVQRRPPEGHGSLPPESWPVTRDALRPYAFADGSAIPAGEPVRDYYNLIGSLGGLDPAVGGREFLVAAKGRVVRLRAELGERATRAFEVRDLARDETRAVDLRLRRLTLSAAGPEDEDAGGFFALADETEIWVDEATGMVARMAGTVPKVPLRVEVLLTAARPLEPAGAASPGR